MTAGRPTTYSEEMLDEAEAYLTNYELIHEHAIPSVAGLCQVIGRARSTVYKWAGEEGKEEFSDMLDRINEKQQVVLFSEGLKGNFNAALAKLALTKHGYSDKQELSGNEGGPIEVDQSWEIRVHEVKEEDE
jgi:hypothetical protein